ncbi:hypothetical protein E2C01_030926 [Portunus trituberculatus]|uniref:Uncharacterized protein n=1 Tax=Portunus trituberculatus TaxID=210409 RepID=A0A5B7EW78_PORTR|nr:hypothetical protein [Portunus trituberculatus]
MWLARVAAVVGLCLGLDALDVPDTPDYLKCANGLFNQVQERLDTDMTALKDQLTGIQGLCAPAITQSTQLVSSPDNTLTLLEKIQVMEETINHMKGKLNAAATKDDLRETEVSISETVEAALTEIEGNVKGNLKEKDAKKLLNESVDVVVQSIGDLGQCASEDKVAAVQERVHEMEQNYMEKIERLEEMVKEILNFTRTPLPTLPPSTITPPGL